MSTVYQSFQYYILFGIAHKAHELQPPISEVHLFCLMAEQLSGTLQTLFMFIFIGLSWQCLPK